MRKLQLERNQTDWKQILTAVGRVTVVETAGVVVTWRSFRWRREGGDGGGGSTQGPISQLDWRGKIKRKYDHIKEFTA